MMAKLIRALEFALSNDSVLIKRAYLIKVIFRQSVGYDEGLLKV